MNREALAWLSEDLSRTDLTSVYSWTRDVHGCARAFGWRNATGSGEGVRVHTVQAPFAGASVEVRAHELIPVVAFLDADQLNASLTTWASSWLPSGHAYINPPGITQWWQARGWIVPDAAWLNDVPAATELTSFSQRRALDARRMGWSRGDLLLLSW